MEETIRESAQQIVKSIAPQLEADTSLSPSQFITKYWSAYTSKFKSNNSLNGKVFEELVAIAMMRADIFPLYLQARVAFIDYVNYDIIIYDSNSGPISISAKTTLRERWKQADLEAVALKHIHRKSESFVVTLDTDAVRMRRIDRSQILGINEFILANTTEFDDFIADLKSRTVTLSPTVQVVSSNIVISKENFHSRYT